MYRAVRHLSFGRQGSTSIFVPLSKRKMRCERTRDKALIHSHAPTELLIDAGGAIDQGSELGHVFVGQVFGDAAGLPCHVLQA
jgi:hypothetical protein